ncbi:MAG: AMP-binding protein [Actinobacteria bacterium]|nr:AMP-binding protein [Actinomycetota bacterium]
MNGYSSKARWAEIAASMDQVARYTAEELATWQLAQLQSLLEHHCKEESPYAAHLARTGVKPGWQPQSLEEFVGLLPVIDKDFLRAGRFDLYPATNAPVTIVSTSGTTSMAACIPHNHESLLTGLGENFARAFIAGGIGDGERHWLTGHWDLVEEKYPLTATGSFLSMYWLSQLTGERALLHNSQISLDDAIAEAVAFQPTIISSSPNLLTRLARAMIERGHCLKVRALLYGGAAATDEQRCFWDQAFQPQQRIAFYPTTDAGAIGVSPCDTGLYECFSETHFVEILDDDDKPVEVGERGYLTVTAYASLAAPIIRYRVGDFVTYEGTKQGRLLVSGISREKELAIGDALLPFAVIESWTARARADGHEIRAVQAVCRSTGRGQDLLVIRLVGASAPAVVERWMRTVIEEVPQLSDSLSEGSVAGLVFEFVDEGEFEEKFKIPACVDERPSATTDKGVR